MTTDTRLEKEQSAFFWVFLGPLSALLSSCLLYIKAPLDFQPVLIATLGGLLLTWVLRLKGLALSIALLALLSVSPLLQAQIHVFWTLGALVAIALSFVLTYLTLDEAEEKVLSWREDVKSHLDSVKVESEKVSHLEKRLLQTENEYITLEKIQELARIELLTSLAEKETVKEELSKVYHAKRKLEEEFEDQAHRLEGNRKLIEKLQNESALNQEMTQHIDTLTREKDLFESTVARLQAELEKPLAPLPITPTPNIEIEVPPANDAEYRRLYGMYKQLREQFAEKTALLDEARRDLFLAGEKNAFFEKEIFELENEEPPQIRQLSQEVELLTIRLEEAHKEISKLEEFVSKVVDSP